MTQQQTQSFEGKTVYLSFTAVISEESVNHLLNVCFNLVNQKASHLYFLISTPGGSVFDGIHAYNVLNGLPIEITMHNSGSIQSIGNAIFLAGDNRIACPHSSFMFHGVNHKISAPISLTEKKLNETLESIKNNQEKIAGIVTQETNITSEEINEMFLVDSKTHNPQFALEKGIITEIKDIEIPEGESVNNIVVPTNKGLNA